MSTTRNLLLTRHSVLPAVGSVVPMELERSGQAVPIEAEITRERLRELDLCEGEKVMVQPRSVRVFPAAPEITKEAA
ncbi:MAG: TOBE-like domain-containing protein [Sterolibacterium sp.]